MHKLATDPIQGYISECVPCDYNNTTMDDAYRYCPMCGKQLDTWEEIAPGEKGEKIYSAS